MAVPAAKTGEGLCASVLWQRGTFELEVVSGPWQGCAVSLYTTRGIDLLQMLFSAQRPKSHGHRDARAWRDQNSGVLRPIDRPDTIEAEVLAVADCRGQSKR